MSGRICRPERRRSDLDRIVPPARENESVCDEIGATPFPSVILLECSGASRVSSLRSAACAALDPPLRAPMSLPLWEMGGTRKVELSLLS